MQILYAGTGVCAEIKKYYFYSSRTCMKRIFLSLILLPSLLFAPNAQAQPDTAKVGIFVLSLYSFDFADKSFTSDFWLWVNHTNDSLDFENSIEITNAKSTEFSMYLDEMKGGIHWVTEKCHAVLRDEWDISNYPFDKQVLSIEIEEGDKDTSELIYMADVENSKIDPNVKLHDWQITGFKVTNTNKTYNTTYGDPELADVSVYSMVKADIELQRIHVWTIFFKLFTGVFVGFLISIFVFFIKPTHVDPRFGLCVGGLFAAVGNKYVVESMVSSSSTGTLIDTIHNLTFVAILFVIVVSIISLYVYEKGEEKHVRLSRIIDIGSFFTSLAAYAGLAIYFVQRAIP